MATGCESTRRGVRARWLAPALGALCVLLLAVRPREGSAFAQDPGSGGLNPAAQRDEMIRLLRSIDDRLARLTDLAKRLDAGDGG